MVRAVDDRSGLTARFASLLKDCRASGTTHSMHDLVRSRVYPILHGYEDCNDLTTLRCDPLFKAACEYDLEGIVAKRKDAHPLLDFRIPWS